MGLLARPTCGDVDLPVSWLSSAPVSHLPSASLTSVGFYVKIKSIHR